MKVWKSGLLMILLVFFITGCSAQDKEENPSGSVQIERESEAVQEEKATEVESAETSNEQAAQETVEMTETLKSVYVAYDIKAGTCLSDQMIRNKRCQEIIRDNFDFNTAGKLVSREVMLARMESYIRQVFEQLEEMGYLELFYAYDVVNEAWMEDGTQRDNLWVQTIGDDYMWYAFYYADMYAPDDIDLYYNDYNEQFKTDTLNNFVQTLVDEDGNYLIDGIGLQAHLYTEDNLEDYLATVEKLGSTGLKVNLTELDVSLGTWTNIKKATEENLKVQGQYYYNLINGLLQLVQDGKVEMDSLTFWGFSDKLSWRRDRSPLLFDSAYEPKYAYYGALQIKEYAGFDE